MEYLPEISLQWTWMFMFKLKMCCLSANPNSNGEWALAAHDPCSLFLPDHSRLGNAQQELRFGDGLTQLSNHRNLASSNLLISLCLPSCHEAEISSVMYFTWYNIWVIPSKKRGKEEGSALNVWFNLYSDPFMWKNKNVQMSFWARERFRSSNVREEVRLKLQIVLEVSGQDAFWMSSWGDVQAHPIEKAWIRSWMCWRDHISHLACEHLAIFRPHPSKKLEEMAGGSMVWNCGPCEPDCGWRRDWKYSSCQAT